MNEEEKKDFFKDIFGKINIDGFEVILKVRRIGNLKFFNSYVELKNSKNLKENILNYPTFRDDDLIGFDTAHYRNEKHSMEEKLLDALYQAEQAIKEYKEVIQNE